MSGRREAVNGALKKPDRRKPTLSHFYISFLPLHLAILGSGYNTESEVVVDVVDT